MTPRAVHAIWRHPVSRSTRPPRRTGRNHQPAAAGPGCRVRGRVELAHPQAREGDLLNLQDAGVGPGGHRARGYGREGRGAEAVRGAARRPAGSGGPRLDRGRRARSPSSRRGFRRCCRRISCGRPSGRGLGGTSSNFPWAGSLREVRIAVPVAAHTGRVNADDDVRRGRGGPRIPAAELVPSARAALGQLRRVGGRALSSTPAGASRVHLDDEELTLVRSG